MRINMSYPNVMAMISDNSTTYITSIEFFRTFDATRRWDEKNEKIVIDFNTDEGYTQFLLTYGEYLK